MGAAPLTDGQPRDGQASAGEATNTDQLQLATLLTATPSLRAKLFANPTRQVGRSLPSSRYWDYHLTSSNPWAWWWERRNARRQLAHDILILIAGRVERGQLAATVNTDAVFEEYFEPIVKASQWSFSSVTLLSWATFIVGVGLIAAGVALAASPPANVNATVVSAIFGGTGAISALGAVYANVKQGIREITVDVARLRMVLTSFATQLGQLRALAEAPDAAAGAAAAAPTIGTVKPIIKALAEATASAVGLIPNVPRSASSDSGQASGPSGTTAGNGGTATCHTATGKTAK